MTAISPWNAPRLSKRTAHGPRTAQFHAEDCEIFVLDYDMPLPSGEKTHAIQCIAVPPDNVQDFVNTVGRRPFSVCEFGTLLFRMAGAYDERDIRRRLTYQFGIQLI